METRPLKNSFLVQNMYQNRAHLGMNLPELTVVLALTGVMAAIIAPGLKIFGQKSLEDTSSRIAGNFRMARAKAISQTSAYRIKRHVQNIPGEGPKASTIIQFSQSCDTPNDSNDWKIDGSIAQEDLILEDDITFQQVVKDGITENKDNWSFCFDSQGIANSSMSLQLGTSSGTEVYQIDIFRGGAVSSQKISE